VNGPEHYAEAERLIALAETCDWTTPWEPYRTELGKNDGAR
jgi:hypothetical protein